MGLGKGTFGKGVSEYLGGGYPGKESLSTRCAGARLSTCVGGGRARGAGLGFERGVGMLREVGVRCGGGGGAGVGLGCYTSMRGGRACIRRN